MIIELMRAWTPEDMEGGECGICGREVAPASVVTYAATDAGIDMDRACESCIEYLGARAPEKCPTIEEYRELLRRYPEPMYTSYDELRASAEATGYYGDPAMFVYYDSWVWTVRDEGDEEGFVLRPTVIYRMTPDGDGHAAAVADTEEGRALIVFRNEEEAEKYREYSGKYPASEGFKPVSLDHGALADVMKLHGCTHVAMPGPWVGGDGGVDTFTAENFIRLLEESPRTPA